jgi:hypothetical protein
MTKRAMTKGLSILWGVAVVMGLSLASESQTSRTPAWLRYLGDGSGGDYSCPSGQCILGDEHWYSSFTVALGATVVTTGGNGPIVIRSTGACTIAGTVSDSPNSGAGVTITASGDFGGTGGGGGGGGGAGSPGFSTLADANLVINTGGSAGAAGAAGGNGVSPGIAQYRLLLGGGTFWPVGGSQGGPGGSNGGAGGYGGGPIIFVCNTIDLTGTIDVSGGPGGGSPGANAGAGGGGGGGYVILSATTINKAGTINTTGGPSGSCNSNPGCGPGGSGGNGWDAELTIQ